MIARPALVRRSLHALALIAPAWGFIALATGGVGWMIGPLRLSSREPWRPILVGLAAAAYLAWRFPRAEIDADGRRLEHWLRRASRLVPALVVVLGLAIGIRYGSFAAGGADSYGYLSQASFLLEGRLKIPQPWVPQFSWPNREYSFAPLGYRPLSEDGTIVPTYPPGLPILMAGFQAAFGANGPFFVVPLLGALGLWLTYLLGKEVTGSRSVGVGASLLMLASPVFLAYVMLPMTDVPVGVAWTLVCLLAMRRPRPHSLAAGLVAGAAILIRPNLVLLAAAPIAGWMWPHLRRAADWRPARVHVVRFGLGMLPAIIAIASLNTYLYGAPLVSGYGSLGNIYSLAFAPENLRNYGLWLLQVQTPLVALAIVPFVARGGFREDEHQVSARACIVALLVVTAISYIFYTPFDYWGYLRFFLPVFPVLFVLMMAGLRILCLKLPGAARFPVAALVCLALICVGFKFARDTFLFNQRPFEQRYVQAALYVDRLTPPNAVILAVQHSGSVRYYSHRITLRYDWLYKQPFDAALRELKEKGYQPFIVVDDWEEVEFRKQFAAQSRVGRLDWKPLARIATSPEVHIYDLEGRIDSAKPATQ